MRPKLAEKHCSRCRKFLAVNLVNFPYRNKEKGYFSSFCRACMKAHKKGTKERGNIKQRARRRAVARSCGCGVGLGFGRKKCDACIAENRAASRRKDKPIRRSRLKMAMPAWADKGRIKEIYENRPEGCHVDHIIPIAGELVCGLHVPENLQYLPAEENMKKSNIYNDGNHYSLSHEGRF